MASSKKGDLYSPSNDYFGLSKLVSTGKKKRETVDQETGNQFFDFEQVRGSFNSYLGLDEGEATVTKKSGSQDLGTRYQYPALQKDDDGAGCLSTGSRWLSNEGILPDIIALRGRDGSDGPLSRSVSWCVFCKNNGESLQVYGSHALKSIDGKTTCPVLRAYRCPICRATGDEAHTIKYCPLSRKKKLPGSAEPGSTSNISTATLYFKTPRNAAGRLRSCNTR
ncbi:nanos homolog 3-like [Diadema setosum]|uniref:nanos homolog 3-like n=1 Tax=Diadema setosum TaxID=31175 RepID=UPI003B3AA1B1